MRFSIGLFLFCFVFLHLYFMYFCDSCFFFGGGTYSSTSEVKLFNGREGGPIECLKQNNYLLCKSTIYFTIFEWINQA